MTSEHLLSQDNLDIELDDEEFEIDGVLEIEEHEGHDIEELEEDRQDSEIQDRIIDDDNIVEIYLRESARTPLLTAGEEISLAKKIEVGKAARKQIKENGDKFSEIELSDLQLLVSDAQTAFEHLVKANTRLVVSIAKKYGGIGVPFLDLIQEGNLGLMRAIDKYDYERGFKFSTYATWWIRQAVSRAVLEQSRTIRVPIHVGERINQVLRIAHQFEEDNGRVPTVEELAEESQISVKKVQFLLDVDCSPLSLDSPMGEGVDSELGDLVEDRNAKSPLEEIVNNALKEDINEALASLNSRDAEILRLRFGLIDGQTYSLEEIGKKFGLTRERIRQLEARALSSIRRPNLSCKLREYLHH